MSKKRDRPAGGGLKRGTTNYKSKHDEQKSQEPKNQEPKNSELVNAVKAVFPGFDKTLLSKCRRTEKYGVEMSPGAKTIFDAVATNDNGDCGAKHIQTQEEAKTPYSAVLGLVPWGRENAISRERLVSLAGCSDRKLREKIEQAKHDGYIIANDGKGAGYYRTNDVDDIEREYWKERKRALSILHRLKHMRRILKEAGRDV